MDVSQLSDNARRRICRISFLLGCLLPTCLILYWVIHPQTAQDWEQLIQARLAVNTTIESVETPSPFETRLRGLEFKDPELGSLLRADVVRVIRGSVNRIVVPNPVALSSSKLICLVNSINDHLIRSHGLDGDWRIEINQARIDADFNSSQLNDSLVLSPLQLEIAPHPDGTVAKLQFQNALEPGNWIRLALHRGKGDARAQQRVVLETHAGYLPCWLVSELVPDLKQLGAECQFSGHIEMLPDPESSSPDLIGYKSQLTGDFRNINLERLLKPFRQKLTGRCIARVSHCLIQGGEIRQLDVQAVCEHGLVGAPLLKAAFDHLKIRIQHDLDRDVVGYRDLEFHCSVRGEDFFVSPGENRANIIAFDSNGNALVGCENGLENPIGNLALFLVQPDVDDQRYHEEIVSLLSRFKLSPAWRIAEAPNVDSIDGPIKR